MSINRVVLTGNLTRDAELRTTAGGLSIAKIGIAVNEKSKNQSTGDWEEHANFFNCTMFGKRAEALAQYLTKGKKVGIDGKLRYSAWQSDDGQKRSAVEIIIDDIELLGSKNDGGGQAQAPSASAYSAPATPTMSADASVYTDDVPF